MLKILFSLGLIKFRSALRKLCKIDSSIYRDLVKLLLWDTIKRVLEILGPTIKKVNISGCLAEVLIDEIRLLINLGTLLWKNL